uniref:Uncharacterized protein n=1 Tax=Oryza meridionalis TaxID=40149 RepID=A0A0E0ECH1_9ORYZ
MAAHGDPDRDPEDTTCRDFRGGEQDEAAQMVFYIFTIVVPLPLLNPHQRGWCQRYGNAVLAISPIGVRQHHPFLGRGIAHGIVELANTIKLQAAAEEEAIAGVQGDDLFALRQERPSACNP